MPAKPYTLFTMKAITFLCHIDAAPMEGFDAAQFDEILGLNEKGLTSSVIAAVGFRAEDDVYSKMIKVRRPKSELFIHI